MDWSLLALLAQDASEAAQPAATTPEPQWLASVQLVAFLIGMIALVVVIPYYLARLVLTDLWGLSKDFATRAAVILGCLVLSTVILWPTGTTPKGDKSKGWPPKLNIDLKGGTILVYELEDRGEALAGTTSDQLIAALRKRIDPAGLNEIVIRARGGRQLEIIIPDKNAAEVDRIKDLISTAGNLNFLLLADRQNEDFLFRRASEPTQIGKKRIYVSDAAEREAQTPLAEGETDERPEPLGIWARVDRESENPVRISGLTDAEGQTVNRIEPLRVTEPAAIYRNALTGQILNSLPQDASQAYPNDPHAMEKYLVRQGIPAIDVLATTSNAKGLPNPAPPVLGGGGRVRASTGFGNQGPEVRFQLSGGSDFRMSSLTGNNLSTDREARYLAIVLDDVVLSTAAIRGTISTQGQITGRFSQAAVQRIVDILNSGSLPATLSKVPISEDNISPLLGWDTILDSAYAMAFSLVIVLVFMVIYYRFAGVVSVIALILNLIFILASMILIGAALSLPGLAGLVLTIGMSVDANVLIFERIREELERGASLRLAIRNGFSRATSTIVDSNVTTLITAAVLYALGSEQVRGFAVTLILGIVVSMFTAIFCSRLIFDVAERKNWIRGLSMGRIPLPTIDFVRLQRPVFVGSMVLILLGLGGIIFRNRDMLDIDFLGGSSVQVLLREALPFTEVRRKVDQGFKDERIEGSRVTATPIAIEVTGTDEDGKDLAGRVVKIDSSYTNVGQFKDELLRVFAGPDGKPGGLLAHFKMTYDPATIRPASASGGPVVPVVPGTGALDGPAALNQAPGGSTEPPLLRSDSTRSIIPGDTDEANDSSGSKAVGGREPGTAPAIPDRATPPTANPGGGSIPVAPESNSSWLPRLSGPAALLAASVLWQDGAAAAQPTAPSETPSEPAPSADSAPPGETPVPEAAPAAPESPAAVPSAATESPADAAPATSGATSVDPDSAAPTGLPVADGTVRTAQPWHEASVTFLHEISRPTLQLQIQRAAEQVGVTLLDGTVRLQPLANPAKADDPQFTADEEKRLLAWTQTPDSELAFNVWQVTIQRDASDVRRILDQLQSNIGDEVFWPASSQIGAQVAGQTQGVAFGALLASFVGIVLYIWFRFQRVVYGLAAIVAVIHDVLVTLGAIAATYFLSSAFGIGLIDEFKINLPMVAAFLTIIGYSINDTIVIFDRIREVKGKSPHITEPIVNRSINSTLSRTMLTSATTLIVALVLFFFGGQGIQGFAFAIVVGVLVGTYSSIFIASPILLWLTARERATAPVATKG